MEPLIKTGAVTTPVRGKYHDLKNAVKPLQIVKAPGLLRAEGAQLMNQTRNFRSNPNWKAQTPEIGFVMICDEEF